MRATIVMQALKANGPCTAKEIAEKLGCPVGAASSLLTKALYARKVTAVGIGGKGRSYRYTYIEPCEKFVAPPPVIVPRVKTVSGSGAITPRTYLRRLAFGEIRK